jgi:hypothetical protein
MAVRRDCRHYTARATPEHDLVARCRIGANIGGDLRADDGVARPGLFACPTHCLFFEARAISNERPIAADGEPGRPGPAPEPAGG